MWLVLEHIQRIYLQLWYIYYVYMYVCVCALGIKQLWIKHIQPIYIVNALFLLEVNEADFAGSLKPPKFFPQTKMTRVFALE